MSGLGCINQNRFLNGPVRMKVPETLADNFPIVRARVAFDTVGGGYGEDSSTRWYSILDPMRVINFDDLQVAWLFRPDTVSPALDPSLHATPLTVDGIPYHFRNTPRCGSADAQIGGLFRKFKLDE